MTKVHFAADPVTLDATGSNADYVTRTGKFFEVGQVFTDMAGVKFGVDELDADAAIAGFTPVELNLGHGPSVFDGLLGKVTRLWRDGKDINAEYSFPRLLHEHMGGKSIPISSEWDIKTKRPVGGALVITPAVQDAVMMSAASAGQVTPETVARFAMTRHNTPQGQTTMQDLHDTCARAGAVCDRGNTANMSGDTANMASQHEAKAIQKIHDMTADHGATCAKGDAPPWVKNTQFSRQPARPASTQGAAPMTIIEKLRAAFSASGVPDDKIPDFGEADFTVTSAPDPADKAKIAALEASVARFAQAAADRDAEAFASDLLAQGRILPYEKAAAVAAFAQAAADDAAHPATVKFSAPGADGKPAVRDGSRVDQIKALYAARPPHGLDKEMFASGRQLTEADFKAVFSRDSATETAEERTARIKAQADAERKAHGLPAKN